MRILLDTHIYLWAVIDDEKLTKEARKIITQASEVFISSASIWEISIKQALGKIEADISLLASTIKEIGFIELPINSNHAVVLNDLPNIHRDPFDRILIAQAIYEPMHFLTADETFKKYSELVIKI